VLDHLLAGDPLDFFASCSSIAALLPTAGQIDYSGANAFLDAFAHAAATRSRCRYIAINWDNWREVGMAVSTEVRPGLKAARAEAIASGLSSTQGQAAFDALLHRRLPQALVTTKVAADLLGQPSTEPIGDRAAARKQTPVGARDGKGRSWAAATPPRGQRRNAASQISGKTCSVSSPSAYMTTSLRWGPFAPGHATYIENQQVLPCRRVPAKPL